jgi:hypothetical protein
LDFAHAICSANHYKQDIYEIVNQYNALVPDMYHLSDGYIDSTVDTHLNYGNGNYDIKRLINDYPADNALITMETANTKPLNIDICLKDAKYLRTIEK